MSWSLKLITIRGIPIRVHASFLLILIWAAYVGLTGSRSGGWLRGVAFMMAFTLFLFLCVVLHELGHSLVAQLFGIKVQDITLWPVGGVARITKMPERPFHEFLITAAGPATNVLLAAILGGAAFVWIGPATLARLLASQREQVLFLRSLNGQTLLLLLAIQNVLLVLFNLIPAFPMDGGRLLRSLLAAFVSYRRATLVASLIGQVLAVALVLLSFIPPANLTLTLIGLFVFLSAWQERQQVTASHNLRGLRVVHAMQPVGQPLHPVQLVREALAQVAASPQSAFLVVDAGRRVGITTRAQLLAAARKSADARINQNMARDLVELGPDATLTEAQERLQTVPAIVVVDGERAIGLLSRADLVRLAEALAAHPGAYPRD